MGQRAQEVCLDVEIVEHLGVEHLKPLSISSRHMAEYFGTVHFDLLSFVFSVLCRIVYILIDQAIDLIFEPETDSREHQSPVKAGRPETNHLSGCGATGEQRIKEGKIMRLFKWSYLLLLLLRQQQEPDSTTTYGLFSVACV